MGEHDHIQFEVVDPVALIRLNRPEKLNAFTYEMLRDLRAAVEAAARDRRVVGIVITGNGRGFCSGLDAEALAETTARGRPAQAAPLSELPGLFTYFLSIPKPILAAVNGVAAGGGFVLAALADLRFAATDARFTTVFLKRGLIAEHGTSWAVPRLVGPGRALDLLWSSRILEAEEAHRIGLVEYLCTPESLLDDARRYIERLCEVASPAAIADTKRLVYRHLGVGYPEALREADEVQWQAIARADAAEGVRALLERRSPRFSRLGDEV